MTALYMGRSVGLAVGSKTINAEPSSPVTDNSCTVASLSAPDTVCKCSNYEIYHVQISGARLMPTLWYLPQVTSTVIDDLGGFFIALNR